MFNDIMTHILLISYYCSYITPFVDQKKHINFNKYGLKMLE